MQKLKKDLKSVTGDLKKLAKKADMMLKKVERLEKKLSAKKPKRKTKKKTAKRPVRKGAGRVTATGTVLSIIQKRKRGINTAELRAKTGFDERKIWNIINILKKQGKVKSKQAGVYIKS